MKTSELKENLKKGIGYINVLFFIFVIFTIIGICFSFIILSMNSPMVGVLIGFSGILCLVLEYYIYKYILSLGQANVLLMNALDKINPQLLEELEDTIPDGSFDFKEKNEFSGFRLPNSYDVEYKLSDSADKRMVMIFTNYLIFKFYETSLDMEDEKQRDYLLSLQYDRYLITEEALQNEVNKLLKLDYAARCQLILDNIEFIKLSYSFIDHFDKNHHNEINLNKLDNKNHFEIIN